MKYIIQDIEKQLQKKNNKYNNKKFNINIDNKKIYKKHSSLKNIQNIKSSIQNNNNNNNNKKDIIQNNQIINFYPIGKKEWNNKILDMYSEEQWKDNKKCW